MSINTELNYHFHNQQTCGLIGLFVDYIFQSVKLLVWFIDFIFQSVKYYISIAIVQV